ncbi:MAG: lysophospholipid acyltransferase family protein [Vicingaceae bacterium]
MKAIKGILSNVYKLYFFLVVVLTLLLLYPAYFILLNQEKYFKKGFHLLRFQAKLILFLVGIRKEVHGTVPNDEKVTYLICPNHSSYLDILMLYATFPHYFVFLGKKELGSIPVFSIFFKRMNILVDRGNAKAAHQAISQACEVMKKGDNVVIFPEGTIPESAPELKAFKNGAFRVAKQLDIPILPVTFVNHVELLEDKWTFMAKCRPGKSTIYLHEPISRESIQSQDLVALREQCKSVIASKL